MKTSTPLPPALLSRMKALLALEIEAATGVSVARLARAEQTAAHAGMTPATLGATLLQEFSAPPLDQGTQRRIIERWLIEASACFDAIPKAHPNPLKQLRRREKALISRIARAERELVAIRQEILAHHNEPPTKAQDGHANQ